MRPRPAAVMTARHVEQRLLELHARASGQSVDASDAPGAVEPLSQPAFENVGMKR
ncbi:hypothetical protein BH20CHL7_BH20CHL7_13850 [soil metagenome]